MKGTSKIGDSLRKYFKPDIEFKSKRPKEPDSSGKKPHGRLNIVTSSYKEGE